MKCLRKSPSTLITFLVILSSSVAHGGIVDELEKAAHEEFGGFSSWKRETIRELNEIRNVKIARTSAGPVQYKKQGRGPVVICLHGPFGGFDQSLLMGEFLMRRGFTVLAVSRPGYLGTPLNVGRGIPEQADAIVELMDTLGIRKAAVFGFSTGSPVAFQMGLRHPQRISAVVATGLGTRAEEAPYYELVRDLLRADRIEVAAYGFHLLARMDLRLTAEEILFPVDSTLPADAVEHRINFMMRHGPQHRFLRQYIETMAPMGMRRSGSGNDMRTLGAWNEYLRGGELRKLRVPMLVVEAMNDANGSFSQTRRIVQAIPRGRLFAVRHSGHFIWVGDKTNHWQTEMVEFLREHP